MDGQQIADIKDAATKAEAIQSVSGAPWRTYPSPDGQWMRVYYPTGPQDDEFVAQVKRREFGEYIARANPSAVLALVAALEEAQRERDNARWAHHRDMALIVGVSPDELAETMWNDDLAQYVVTDSVTSLRAERDALQQRLDALRALVEAWPDGNERASDYAAARGQCKHAVLAALSVPVVSPATEDEK